MSEGVGLGFIDKIDKEIIKRYDSRMEELRFLLSMKLCSCIVFLVFISLVFTLFHVCSILGVEIYEWLLSYLMCVDEIFIIRYMFV